MRLVEDEIDYDTYFGKEVWGGRKNGNENLKEVEFTGNNLIII